MSIDSVAFRVDASLEMGVGHVMRNLTLANALKAGGASTRFICRHLPSYLRQLLLDCGHSVVMLTGNEAINLSSELKHAKWLGVNQTFDAKETMVALAQGLLAGAKWDWVVIDHYAINQIWEKNIRSCAQNIMVIDDLADRVHDCDVILDQTLSRQKAAYKALVPKGCIVLTGADYSLLRPEFMRAREYSLSRRQQIDFKHVLITMGGIDLHNATGAVLEALRQCALPEDCRITVVLGEAAPALEDVRVLAETMPWLTRLRVNVVDMAAMMAECDLVIGAAGTTSWERCCLGVPSFMVVLADNQKAIASALQAVGAAIDIGDPHSDEFVAGLKEHVLALLLDDYRMLKDMSLAAAKVTRGNGVDVVVATLQGRDSI